MKKDLHGQPVVRRASSYFAVYAVYTVTYTALEEQQYNAQQSSSVRHFARLDLDRRKRVMLLSAVWTPNGPRSSRKG